MKALETSYQFHQELLVSFKKIPHITGKYK